MDLPQSIHKLWLTELPTHQQSLADLTPTPEARLAAPYRSPIDIRLGVAQVAASGFLLFALGGAVGGVLGYGFGQQPNVHAEPVVALDSGWLDDVVAHYRLFSNQPSRRAEMPGSDPAAVTEWLLASTGINFRVPDLSENGLTFEGARLFAAGGLPVGELVYTSQEGEVISILFRKNRPEDDGFSELIRDNIALLSWKNATTTYLAVGPSSAASLDEIAAKAAGLI